MILEAVVLAAAAAANIRAVCAALQGLLPNIQPK